MTPTTEGVELLPVTPADREAAALMHVEVLLGTDVGGAHYRRGKGDDSPLVQAFARHRIQATTAPADVVEALARKLFEAEGPREIAGATYDDAYDYDADGGNVRRYWEAIAEAALASLPTEQPRTADSELAWEEHLEQKRADMASGEYKPRARGLVDIEGHLADAIRDGFRLNRGGIISFGLSSAVAKHCLEHLTSLARIDTTLSNTPSSDRMDADRKAVLSGWQPIETAPKDGTSFVGSDGHYAYRTALGKHYVKWPHEEGGPTFRELWNAEDGSSLWPWKPTHWMPLPEALADKEATR